MSEEKHTPKRWSQGKKGNFRDVVFLVHWNESHGIPIDRNMWIDCNNAENASLIAAAPDLLAALIAMLDLDQQYHQRFAGDEDMCAEVQAARAAIAKATGKTP